MTEGFKKGDLICVEKPYVCVLNNAYRKEYCDHCFKRNTYLRRCSQCMFMYYCDKHCQKQAWVDHKKECKIMKGLHTISLLVDDVLDTLILVSRIFFKCQEKKVSQTIGTYRRTYNDLESHFEEFCKNKLELSPLLTMFKLYIGRENISSEEEIIKIYGKARINILGIYGPETPGIIGSGLYIGASIFDHSCDPDCVAFFRGPDVYVRAVRDIPTRDVKNITIRYRGALFPTKQRQEGLRKHYFFTCQCKRCTSPEFDEYLTKVLDESKALDVIKLSEETEEKLTVMRANGASASEKMKTLAYCLKRQEGVLSDGHYLRFQLLSDAMNLSTQLNKHHKAVEYGLKGLEALKFAWGEFNADVITRLYRLSQLYVILGNIEESQKMLQQAYEASCQLFGADDEFSMKLGTMNNYCK